MRAAEFHYDLPAEAIAQTAVEPRHDSRLLDTRDMTDHRFLDLADLLAPGDLVVVNDTRVRAARLTGTRKGTGGRVELLILEKLADDRWEALARPARRLRPGVVIELGEFDATVASDPVEGRVEVIIDVADPEQAISSSGSVPLPPYFTGDLVDPNRYQTIFAANPGSAAAPTAGLHFTREVLDRLAERDVTVAAVDLHVSLDTFRPMAVTEIEDHEMHSEWCSIPTTTAREIAETRQRSGRVVAVGTTVVRTLESMADGDGGVVAGEGRTDLFLRPGSNFTVVDLLVTNFHLPGSTLLVLLAGFMGESWRTAYEVALRRGFRFLSFGDAMLAERQPT
ncbi:MAG TPA: tRNA preQ1(34) S-adenosylmethionine ribosyltransferase-isomerase QueA [Acidimicrobiia bacterium]|nr:tRNA preQ1(34) S-adenosylmethionine ribosyltransferase-isomerase QueA [Acidimicrobiia bacterium]